MGTIIFAFVIGFTIGVLAMAFFKGESMAETSTKLFLREQLLQEMIDDWLKIFVRHTSPVRSLDQHQNDFFTKDIAQKWVGARGRINQH